MAIFAVNRSVMETVEFEADLRGFEGYRPEKVLALEGTDMKAVNSAAEEKVKPVERTDARMDGGLLSLSLKPASFVTIVLKKETV